MTAARPLTAACAIALALLVRAARAGDPAATPAPGTERTPPASEAPPATGAAAPARGEAPPQQAPAGDPPAPPEPRHVEATTVSVTPPPQPPAATPLVGTPTSPKDRDAELRALERALTERGGLLLRAWQLELAPEMSFSGADASTAVVTSGGVYGGTARTQLLVGAVTLRLGLPFDLQLEGSIPFGEARRTVAAGGQSWSRDRWGIGDVRLALSYQLWRGGGRAPDVLVAATWKGATAASPFASPLPQWVSIGSGLVDVGGTLTVVKPADPLVLLGSVGVARSLPATTPLGRVDAGITTSIDLAAILAVSPDTSISLGFDQKFAPSLQIDGRGQPGTDRMAAALQVGVATIVSGRSFVQLTASAGLTRDAPAFQLGLSAPIRLR